MQVSKELVPAVVELVKDDYLVLSLPQHGQALGFAAAADFNLQHQEGRSAFTLGQQLQARITALPSAATGTQPCTLPSQPVAAIGISQDVKLLACTSMLTLLPSTHAAEFLSLLRTKLQCS